MNQKILISILLLISTSSFSQVKDEDAERNRIKQNKIQKSTQWTYKYTKGKPTQKGYITTETKFDKSGNQIEVLNYKSTGQISSKLFYKYDDNNYKTEFSQYQKINKPELEVAFKQSFTYDKNGNKQLEDGFDGATTYKIQYTYNTANKLKDVIKHNSQGFVSEKWEYTYSGDLITISIFKQLNKLDRKIIRKVDATGNIIEETNTNATGKELQKTISDFDPNGRIIELKEFYSGNHIKTLNYKYNSQNQIVEVSQINPDGKKFLNHSYKYDTKGSLIEERWFDGVPDDYSSKIYKYDNKSNVVEIECYYSDYKYKVLYKFNYEFY